MFPQEVPHLEQEALSKHTTYRIGGPARIFAKPVTKDHLWQIGKYLQNSGEGYFVLGNGSNVLAPDQGFPGVVICTLDLEPGIKIDGKKVLASAGTLNSRLLRECADHGLGGIEYLSGVPGNLGGAIFMNAGTASGWIDSVAKKVEATSLLGGCRWIELLSFSYRKQHFLEPHEIVTAAELQLIPEEPALIKSKLAESSKKRKAAQPIELPSCGSVFQNPPGKNAWRVVEELGLKGLKQGGAAISEKHSNFIVNLGGATAADVLYLVNRIKKEAKEKLGLEMHQEVVVMEAKHL